MTAETKIAKTITRAHQTRMIELVKELHLAEVTPKTFVYVDRDGNLAATEKQYRGTSLIDSAYDIGYALDAEYAGDVRKALNL